MNKTRDELIAMSDEELMCWAWGVPIGSTVFSPPETKKEYKEFIKRQQARLDVSLTRAGILLKNPTTSGELIIDLE